MLELIVTDVYGWLLEVPANNPYAAKKQKYTMGKVKQKYFPDLRFLSQNP